MNATDGRLSRASAGLPEILRVLPGGSERIQAALASVDLSRLPSTAARHGVAAFIYEQLAVADGALPARTELELRRHAMATIAAGMRVRSLAVRAIEAMRVQGVSPVLLKGVGLADRIYPTPACRATSDVDLLVSADSVRPAVKALRSLSLSPKVESDGYYPPGFRYHLSYGGASGLVELHFRAMSVFGRIWGANELIARSIPGELDGVLVRYLRPEDEFLYLAVHAANHMLQRVGWLVDLKLFISRYSGLDWNEVLLLASKTRTRTLLYAALDASRRLVGATFPVDVLEALRPSRRKCWVIERAFAKERLVQGYLLEHKAIWALTKFAISDDLVSLSRFSAARVLWWLARRRNKSG